jgi:hypothetical protein
MSAGTDDAVAVDTMLAAAGLRLPADDRRALVELYRQYRPRVDALYEVPEARYEAPAQVFQAAGNLKRWDER